MTKQKNTKVVRQKRMRSVDQMTIARLVAHQTGLTLTEVQEVIELEQKYTMDFIKRDRKVIKKNYLTLTPIVQKGRRLKCPIDGKDYELPTKRSVSVRLGDGFKAYISGISKKMPDKLCRFVDGKDLLSTEEGAIE